MKAIGSKIQSRMKVEKHFERFFPFHAWVWNSCGNDIRRQTLLLKCF